MLRAADAGGSPAARERVERQRRQPISHGWRRGLFPCAAPRLVREVILSSTLPDLLLRADARTRGIRVAALTAFAMKGDEQKAYDAGCDGYITKPVDTRALPGQVAALLRIRKPSS